MLAATLSSDRISWLVRDVTLCVSQLVCSWEEQFTSVSVGCQHKYTNVAANVGPCTSDILVHTCKSACRSRCTHAPHAGTTLSLALQLLLAEGQMHWTAYLDSAVVQGSVVSVAIIGFIKDITLFPGSQLNVG